MSNSDFTSGVTANSATPESTSAETRAIAQLRDPATIRERAHRIYGHARDGHSTHFSVDEGALPALAEEVVRVTRAAYPTLAIPYHSRWNHFRVGGVDRVAQFDERIASFDSEEQGRRRFELVITSVLLDAGAGPTWGFVDDGVRYTRSEGLAVASQRLFEKGAFSSDGTTAIATADGLRAFNARSLADAFQVTDDNPLVGVEGRSGLLRRLGEAVDAAPHLFGGSDGGARLGGLFDALIAQQEEGKLPAERVLAAVLEGLGPIWPGRLSIAGENLGDIWRHPAAGGDGLTEGLMPFHKLSQWLTYSLLEPLEWAGVTITDLGALTGLAEYRNGGLFIDGGVLSPRDPQVLADAQPPESELIVEWRALTIALLDEIAPLVRKQLGLNAVTFPLAKVLEGGTWQTGRQLARARRPDGRPPIRLASDGTVF